MKKSSLRKLMLITAALSFSVLACIVTGRTGNLVEEREVIQGENLESAEVTLRMGAGRLEIGSGVSALMEGVFTYSDRNYAPMIDFVETGSGAGELVVEQEEVRSLNLNGDYVLEWDLTFTDEIPLDLYVSLGAGEAVLDTSGLNLSAFELDMGAGEATLILPGQVQEDLEVSIQGGVGQLNVEIAEGTPVYAEIAGGLGSVDVHGLIQEGSAYHTPSYGDGPAVYLDIEGGVGEINLRVR